MADTVLKCYVAKYFGVPEGFVEIIRKESSTNIYFTIKDGPHIGWDGTYYIIGQLRNKDLEGIDVQISFKLYKHNEIDKAIHELSFNNDLQGILNE